MFQESMSAHVFYFGPLAEPVPIVTLYSPFSMPPALSRLTNARYSHLSSYIATATSLVLHTLMRTILFTDCYLHQYRHRLPA